MLEETVLLGNGVAREHIHKPTLFRRTLFRQLCCTERQDSETTFYLPKWLIAYFFKCIQLSFLFVFDSSNCWYPLYINSFISGQCSTVEEDCQSIRCQHQGTCAIAPAGSDAPVQAVCHCPLGFEGKFCENAIEIEVSWKPGANLLKKITRVDLR